MGSGWGGSVWQVALCDVGPLQDEGLQRVLETQPMLTRLQLGPCTQLTEVLVSALVLKLPHLTHLALSGCALLGDGALVCIAEGLPSLKSLLLTESAGFADAVCPPPQPPYLHRVLSVHALRAHGGSGMSKRLLVSAHGCSWP